MKCNESKWMDFNDGCAAAHQHVDIFHFANRCWCWMSNNVCVVLGRVHSVRRKPVKCNTVIVVHCVEVMGGGDHPLPWRDAAEMTSDFHTEWNSSSLSGLTLQWACVPVGGTQRLVYQAVLMAGYHPHVYVSCRNKAVNQRRPCTVGF